MVQWSGGVILFQFLGVILLQLTLADLGALEQSRTATPRREKGICPNRKMIVQRRERLNQEIRRRWWTLGLLIRRTNGLVTNPFLLLSNKPSLKVLQQKETV